MKRKEEREREREREEKRERERERERERPIAVFDRVACARATNLRSIVCVRAEPDAIFQQWGN